MTVGIWLGHGGEHNQDIYAPLMDSVGRITGIDFQLRSLPGRKASLDAFRSGQVDLLLTGSREYLIARAQSGAKLIASLARPDHYAVVAVRGDLVKNRSDLKGRSVIMSPGDHISEELAPLHLILQMGLNPYGDVSMVRLDPASAWQSFRRGRITAIAVSYNRLNDMMDRDRNFFRRHVRILGRGPDLPGDVLLIRPDAKPSVVSRIQDAFRSHAAVLDAILGAGMGGAFYRNAAFTTRVTEQDYHFLLTMMAELGQFQFAGSSD